MKANYLQCVCNSSNDRNFEGESSRALWTESEQN